MARKKANATKSEVKAPEQNNVLNGKSAENSVTWEWENTTWVAYSSQQLEAINKAYNKGQKTVTVSFTASTKFIINFNEMMQNNKKTGEKQKVRCCVLNNSDSCSYVWYRNLDNTVWNSYLPLAALNLENAFQNSDSSCSIHIDGKQYNIDLNTLTETDVASGNARQVIRIKSTDSLPSVSSSTSVNSTKSGKRKVENNIPSTSKRTKKSKPDSEPVEEIAEKTTKTILIKGKAPVDSECTNKVGKAHVYCEGDDIYDAMLNQTNLQFNNNKYYIIQLLEDDNQPVYSVWFRWGRVGKKGQNSLDQCGNNLQKAKQLFEKKFLDKTCNHWEDRKCFKKKNGKYDLISMDYKIDDETKDNLEKQRKEPILKTPKIDKRIQNLIELICNVKSMEEMVMEMQYDAKKAPLGKLTVAQIKAGYAALKKIEECINKNQMGGKLLAACNEFYTRIPHDFGMKRPPLIQTTEEIRIKIQLLEALGDIQIAMKMLNDELEDNMHPVDRHYNSLDCDMKPLDPSDSVFKMIEEYLQNTHAKTHSLYTLKIIDVFECNKDQEKKKFKDVGNKCLLWHGSRLTNWVGILKQGLRIAPPEAPVTGYMFGKGVYFADMCSKSANYCFTTRTKNEGLLLLCEVSLGNCNKLIAADYNADKLPEGMDSTMGLGSVAPNPKMDKVLPNGTRVPLGKPLETNVNNPNGYTLNYNEYIVYNTDQIQMRYLIHVRFNYK